MKNEAMKTVLSESEEEEASNCS